MGAQLVSASPRAPMMISTLAPAEHFRDDGASVATERGSPRRAGHHAHHRHDHG